jgi:hypothetical protein
MTKHVAVATKLLLVGVEQVQEVLPLVQDLLPYDLDLGLAVVVFTIEVGDHFLDILKPVFPEVDVTKPCFTSSMTFRQKS